MKFNFGEDAQKANILLNNLPALNFLLRHFGKLLVYCYDEPRVMIYHYDGFISWLADEKTSNNQ
jgi:hypothetical protein